MPSRLLPGAVLAALLILPLAAAEEKPGRRVVLMVWDGMRPDFVTAETTPNLHALAQRGVFFSRHHAVFPSSTEVNGTAMATGSHPRRSGIVANREYRPEIDPLKGFDTQDRLMIAKGDELSGGKYVGVPTIAELVQRSGQRTALAGTKNVILLQDRGAGRTGETSPISLNVFGEPNREGEEGEASGVVPRSALRDLLAARGSFPSRYTYPNVKQDEWMTSTLIDYLWRDGVPVFSTLWSSDPDYTQHQHGPGSPEALAALRSADGNLGRVIAALEQRGLLEQTDIMVVSDHGFSTIEHPQNVSDLLRTAGFEATRELRKPLNGKQVMVVGNGGTVCLYVANHDEALTRALVESLQTTAYCGTIFSRVPAEGAFLLKDANLDTAAAPDVLISMRWIDAKSERGIPGLLWSDGRRPRGSGTHATLSRYDQRNTLIAAGPDFRRGVVSEIPSGNIDVAPTILHLLHVANPGPMDGRILAEALAQTELAAPPPAETTRLEARRAVPGGEWHQYLQVTRVGDATYFDEGNGGVEPAK